MSPRQAQPNAFADLNPMQGELKLRTDFAGRIIVGVDEAGRGPLAGPVVAAVAVLPSADCIPELADSKALSETRREALFPRIQEIALAWAIAEATPAEIDLLNILQADFLAMRRALAAIGFSQLQIASPTHEEIVVMHGGQTISDIHNTKPLCAIDGNLPIAGLSSTYQFTVIKGDAHVASIAAASILAKVHRDARMVELDKLYPQYGLAKHKGYPSKSHQQALQLHGASPIHRRSFRGVIIG